MRSPKAACAFMVVLTWSGVAFAQDPVKVDPGHYKVVLENASVRVLRVSYPVGAKSPAHQHPDGIILALSAAKTQFTADGKTTDTSLGNETAMYAPAGTHSVTNVGPGAVDALVIELKSPAPGKATLPPTREGLAMKVLAEGPRAVAHRTTASPTFEEPAGSKHDYDQVVIALASVGMSLAIDGKPAKTTWTRGDVQFIGRGVAHQAKNGSGKPADFVIVSIK
jgi:beta-alanine degradation protein BauB